MTNITQTWAVKAVKTWDNLQGMDQIVSEVQWQLITEDSTRTQHKSHAVVGSTRLGQPLLQEFIPWNQLTEMQLLEWAWAAMGPVAREQVLRQGWDYMAYTASSESQTTDLPWNQ